jgi:hypothetical protein
MGPSGIKAIDKPGMGSAAEPVDYEVNGMPAGVITLVFAWGGGQMKPVFGAPRAGGVRVNAGLLAVPGYGGLDDAGHRRRREGERAGSGPGEGRCDTHFLPRA